MQLYIFYWLLNTAGMSHLKTSTTITTQHTTITTPAHHHHHTSTPAHHHRHTSTPAHHHLYTSTPPSPHQYTSTPLSLHQQIRTPPSPHQHTTFTTPVHQDTTITTPAHHHHHTSTPPSPHQYTSTRKNHYYLARCERRRQFLNINMSSTIVCYFIINLISTGCYLLLFTKRTHIHFIHCRTRITLRRSVILGKRKPLKWQKKSPTFLETTWNHCSHTSFIIFWTEFLFHITTITKDSITTHFNIVLPTNYTPYMWYLP